MNNEESFSLYDNYGRRKYLNEAERKAFYKALDVLDEEKTLYALMIFWTGARPSEVLNLSIENIDFDDNVVIFRNLKKRKKISFRPIPLPHSYIKRLAVFIKHNGNTDEIRIWQFSYRSGHRYVKKVMITADIHGIHACARGLRHSFAVKAVIESIPLTTIQKWMGHSSLRTTAIYLNVIGKEERKFAQRMWNY